MLDSRVWNSERRLKILAMVVFAPGLIFLQSACNDSQPAEAAAAHGAVSTPPVPASTPERDRFFLASGPLIVEHQIMLPPSAMELSRKFTRNLDSRFGKASFSRPWIAGS